MKNLVSILALSFFCVAQISAVGQTENMVTSRILYTVRFDNREHKEGGFYNHLDSTTKSNLINQICDLVFERKLQTSYYWGDEIGSLPYYSPVGEHLTKYYFKRNDTARYRFNSPPYENKTIGDVTRDDYVYRYLINSLSFYEKWYFDIKTNVFSKKVSSVILFEDKFTHNIGMNCNYSVALNDTTNNEYNPKYLVAKNIIYDVPVTKGDTIFNEYNWWYNYIEASKRERFFSILEYKALDDTTHPFKTYDGKYPYDSLIKKTEFINVGLGELFYGRSNWNASDPLLSGMTPEKIQARSYELADWTTIKKIRFHEEWYFDPNNLRFEKKVLGIGMIVDTFNDEGKKTGEKCLVYYKLNN